MFLSIKQFLNQPYPDRDDFPSIIIGSILSGIIVFLILAFFKPFGLADTGPDTFILALIYSLITILTVFFFELFVKFVLKIKRDTLSWTLWKWMIITSILLFCIAIANYFFSIYYFRTYTYSVLDFGSFLYNTILVGLFPILIVGSLNVIKNMKTFQALADNARIQESHLSQNQYVQLAVKNSKKIFEIDVSNILYVEAMQNYVLIYYLDENSKVNKEMHRNTLASVDAELSKHGLLKTHRSFIVNPTMIEAFSGNAQGLKLRIKHINNSIVPVSRKYVGLFK